MIRRPPISTPSPTRRSPDLTPCTPCRSPPLPPEPLHHRPDANTWPGVPRRSAARVPGSGRRQQLRYEGPVPRRHQADVVAVADVPPALAAVPPCAGEGVAGGCRPRLRPGIPVGEHDPVSGREQRAEGTGRPGQYRRATGDRLDGGQAEAFRDTAEADG